MIEPLSSEARDWLKHSKDMDADYANQVDEYIDRLEEKVKELEKQLAKESKQV